MKKLKFTLSPIFLMLMFFANFQARAALEELEPEELELKREAILNSLPEEVVHNPYKLADAAGAIGGEVGLAILMELEKDVDDNRNLNYRIDSAVNRIVKEGDLSLLRTILHSGMAYYVRTHRVTELIDREGLELKELAEDEDPLVRRLVIFSRELGTMEGLAILRYLAEDEDPRVRKSIVRSVGNIDIVKNFNFYYSKFFQSFNWREERDAILMKLVKDKDPEVRGEVARKASNIGSETALAILMELVQDENPEVRKQVAREAGQIKGEVGLAISRQLVQDEDPEVRKQVVENAIEIGGEAGAELLLLLGEASS